MIKLIYRYVLPLVLLLVAALVGYNYYFGDDEERKKSERIIGQVKGLGSDVFSLLQSEKEKFDRGKYDDAMDKIGSAMSSMKEQAGELADGGKELLGKLDKLEDEKAELQKKLDALEQSDSAGTGDTTNEAAELQEGITNLAEQTEQLSLELEE